MTSLLSVCTSLHCVDYIILKSTEDMPYRQKDITQKHCFCIHSCLSFSFCLFCCIHLNRLSTCFTFAGYTRQTPNHGNTPQPLSPCVLCSCTGRSRDCHPENGTCYNCRTGSEGEHCEWCQPGVDNSTDCKRCIPGFFGLTPSSGGCRGNGKFIIFVQAFKGLEFCCV